MITSKLLLVYLLTTANIFGINVDTSKVDTEEAYCLAKNVYYEARSENIQGQYAVASVTINRVNDVRFPNTICDVVTYTVISKISKKLVCAFSWYCDNNKNGTEIPIRNKDGTINQQVLAQFRAASIVAITVLGSNVKDITYGATHFHNPNISNPSWKYTLTKTTSIGNHAFYK